MTLSKLRVNQKEKTETTKSLPHPTKGIFSDLRLLMPSFICNAMRPVYTT